MPIHKEHGKNLCVLHKNLVKEFLKFGGFERMVKMANEMNLLETQVLFFCKKLLKECSLKEIMDGIVQTFKVVNIFEKYGVKTESDESENNLFMKIHKNLM